MTTKVTITNDPTSNGDLVLDGTNTTEGKIRGASLRPGESRELWITTNSVLVVSETWPTRPKNASDTDILACGANGEAWAKAFTNQFPAADEDTMRAWFQNAIEAACAARTPVDPVTISADELATLRDKAWKYDELSK